MSGSGTRLSKTFTYPVARLEALVKNRVIKKSRFPNCFPRNKTSIRSHLQDGREFMMHVLVSISDVRGRHRWFPIKGKV
jgi:hypothetical protein